ncbi:MAG: hypothetical protein K9N23_08125 [Akkermansiaceae bacterium]|nr:hypothetical protein [Akkermansiaceae bacterium]
MPSAAPQSNSSLLDNRAHRGTVGEFLKSEIQPGSDLSFVSAYFTVHAYEALEPGSSSWNPNPEIFFVKPVFIVYFKRTYVYQ